MTATHRFSGYGCFADMATLATRPEVRDFQDSPVQLLAARQYEVFFLADEKIWITDDENWKQHSRELVA